MRQPQLKAHKNTSNEANNENSALKNLRLKNSEKFIFGQINISSLRNVRDEVNLITISEIRVDCSYRKSYSKLYWIDRNSKGGGVILYVWEDDRSKLNKIVM